MPPASSGQKSKPQCENVQTHEKELRQQLQCLKKDICPIMAKPNMVYL
jgi:hypothetical protein